MQLPLATPAPGEKLLRFVGDRLCFTLSRPADATDAFRAFVRTNLTRARVARAEVVAQSGLRLGPDVTFAGASWRDIPLTRQGDVWQLDLPLLEVGHFLAKPYCVDAEGRQRWPVGNDLSISVHPDALRTANLIYCAFPRALGGVDERLLPRPLGEAIHSLDDRGYHVIPPSGTLRSLTRQLPHIFDELGCRVLHLLPIGPVPTTHARMGRYGSPYAQLDLTQIDPALIEHDKRTTPTQQFLELADGVHLRGGLVLLDIVLNHTGWASRLFDEHPEWFLRNPDGSFRSPGAWGVIWADLVELDQSHTELWETLADSLLTWCRRGVDGFRCDAGYMIPLRAWQYVLARVRLEYPDCVFLLEGLGGGFQDTEALLTEGGMQWAYSELFQNYEPEAVARYVDHANHHSERIGTLVHYSETHDNPRLAAKGARWSLMRNRLCALTSHVGGFGFTAGVEWLCDVRLDVHEGHSLGIGNEPNLVRELGKLTRLLRGHPCFFDGAHLERLSPESSPVLALTRESRERDDRCLVLINLDVTAAHSLTLAREPWERLGAPTVDLLGQPPPGIEHMASGAVCLTLGPGESFCLAAQREPVSLSGDRYRARRAQAAWAYVQLGQVLPHEALADVPYDLLGARVAQDPEAFLHALGAIEAQGARADLLAALDRATVASSYRRVVVVTPEDARRVTLLPPDHWLLVRDTLPFEADILGDGPPVRLRSIVIDEGHIAALAPHPGDREQDITVEVERFGDGVPPCVLHVRRLPHEPVLRQGARDGIVLLTNGRGAMLRMHTDLGRIRSKYDCVLGANLHPDTPTDRHVFVKRLRAWVNANGFTTPLDAQNLVSFSQDKDASWTFFANGGDGHRVGVRLTVGFVIDRNEVTMRFSRVVADAKELPSEQSVHVIARLDLEDRSFHHETHADAALEAHFAHSTTPLADARGFVFAPDSSRALQVRSQGGRYHDGLEWSRGLDHSLDRERHVGNVGDAFSPGWFELPITDDGACTLHLTATCQDDAVHLALSEKKPLSALFKHDAPAFEAVLRRAAGAFLVRRGNGRSVIAGYPWFLDWGRDTLIAARGYLAAGLVDEVQEIVRTYAGLERNGTLPNLLSSDGAVSHETSDAPLLLGLVAEELAEKHGDAVYDMDVGGRSLLDVLTSIVTHHLRGAENGVIVDAESGLVWSPSHFTWMDTNYPAGTPREGYPIEIAALWTRLVRQLMRRSVHIEGTDLAALAERAEASVRRFYRPELGYCADTLHAPRGTPASSAQADDHLRPNQLFAISLGLLAGEPARQACRAVERYLLIPGALRSLAPLTVRHPLPVHSARGEALNDPHEPYFGHYEGPEDWRRKPAYHNGTGWGFLLPSYAEALVHAHPADASARAAARAVLASASRLLDEGCLGQLPENVDGDAPHRQRGCDAQAWSVTETLRVWLLLQ